MFRSGLSYDLRGDKRAETRHQTSPSTSPDYPFLRVDIIPVVAARSRRATAHNRPVTLSRRWQTTADTQHATFGGILRRDRAILVHSADWPEQQCHLGTDKVTKCVCTYASERIKRIWKYEVRIFVIQIYCCLTYLLLNRSLSTDSGQKFFVHARCMEQILRYVYIKCTCLRCDFESFVFLAKILVHLWHLQMMQEIFHALQ